MKELSIEEKATRYDQAIKVAKSKIKNDKNHVLYEDDVIEMFPELKESEEERIRKEIIIYLYNELNNITQLTPRTNEFERWIAWLEKQGEQPKKHDVCDNCDQQGSCVSPCPMKLVENQGEQEHVVVIPKFRVGDVIRPKGSTAEYTIESISGECYHGKGWGLHISCDNDYELVEQKPAEWSEEDETNIGRAIDIIKDAKEGLLSYKTDDGIYECEQAIKVLDKLLKNGYSVLWKEADYDNIEKLIKILPQCIFRHPHILERDECLKLVSWLKSLRPQKKWKPSDEQIKAVRLARSFVTDDFSDNPTLSEILIELEEQLKKLKE